MRERRNGKTLQKKMREDETVEEKIIGKDRKLASFTQKQN